MRGDVLKTISSAEEVTNAIVLTHNIDFVFIQTVALAAFRRCGHPTLTIFADATCAAESFAHQQPVLTGLGVRYRVVPVAMQPGFRFHPKAVLLASEETATLLVGSGNLTFGGWRENAEVWLRFDSENDGVAPLLAFRSYLTEILAHVPLAEVVAAEVDDAFDAKKKRWMSLEPGDDGMLVGRVGSGNSLLNRLVDSLGEEHVDELVVHAPYFDEDGVGLRELVTETSARRTTVLCQPERSTLTQRAWDQVSDRAVLQRIDFRRKNVSGEDRAAFLHAKFYAFRRDQEVFVLAGSANCSRAALTMSGRAGNAELQAVRVCTPGQFDEEFLGELATTSEPVVLREGPETDRDKQNSAGPMLRILAARLNARSLLIAYTPPEEAVVECLVDSVPTPFKTVERGVLRATSTAEPRVVAIRSKLGGRLAESAPFWIDHERYLGATARGRSLAESIRTRIRPDDWNAGAWADVLDVFCKHLRYMPMSRTGRGASRLTDGGGADENTQFTAADVFSPDYRIPNLASIRIPLALGGNAHVESLQQLLLRWFGVPAEEPEVEDETSVEIDAEGDADAVDRPESLKTGTPLKTPPAREPTGREKRRIDALLLQLEKAMTSHEFLAERDSDSLAGDIKLASALLRLGLREAWIEHKRFFDITQRIWSALFFSSEPQGVVGWLEHRARTADDNEAFINDMRSADLSAALIGWKLGAPTHDATPEASRFELATVLAVARLPWLWQGGDPEKIAEELAVLLSSTSAPGASREAILQQAEAEWDLLLRRGQALRLLEAAVSHLRPAEICQLINTDKLRPGDLLWQGTAGFCVVRQQASRIADDKVTVLRLQGRKEEGPFKASYTVPMRALLSEEVVPLSGAFGGEPRRVLREFIDSLSGGFAK